MEDSNPYLEAEIYKGAPQESIIEPVLPLMDEWARDVVIQACYAPLLDEKGEIKLNSGNPVYYVKYPDILLLASTGIGHLEALSHYTWEQGMSILLDWEGFNLDPLIDKYYRNAEAQRALFAIKHCMTRQIIGGSIEGAHQDFMVRYRGGDRKIRISREVEQRR